VPVAADGETVAVKVTVWPYTDVAEEVVTAVVVPCSTTILPCPDSTPVAVEEETALEVM
jgi:hypothetical protein